MEFEYKPFINPYIGSISELMGKGDEAKAAALIRIGEIQARAAEQQGQAWGNAIQGLGNLASKTITDYNSPEAQDRRAAEKAKAIFNEMGKAETQTTQGLAYRNVAGGAGAVPAELTRSELSFDSLGNPKVGADGKYVRTEVPGAAAIPGTLPSRQGFPTITRTNPYRVLAESGVKNLDMWDIDAASKNFAKNNVPPELAFKYTQIMRTSNADMEEHHEKAMSIMRRNAFEILQFSPNARLGAAQQLLEKYQNNGVLSYKDLQNARQQLDSIAALPAGEQAVATSKFLLGLSGQPDVILNQNPGDVGRSTLTNEIFAGPAAKPVAPTKEGFAAIIGDPTATTEQKASAQLSLDSLTTPPDVSLAEQKLDKYAQSLGLPDRNGLTNAQLMAYDKQNAINTHIESQPTPHFVVGGDGNVYAVNQRTNKGEPVLSPDGTPMGAPLSASTRTMSEGAKAILPHVADLRADADKLDALGLFGALQSRIRAALAKMGTLDLSDSPEAVSQTQAKLAQFGADLNKEISQDKALTNKDVDRLVGRFTANLKLMASGVGRVHGGARGGGSIQMINYMTDLLSSDSTVGMFQGRLDAVESYMNTYAKPGGNAVITPRTASPAALADAKAAIAAANGKK